MISGCATLHNRRTSKVLACQNSFFQRFCLAICLDRPAVSANWDRNFSSFPSSDIMSWLTYDGKVDLDTEQVRQYVTDLGTKYNTSTNDTKFKSTKRGEVTVPVGTYSWTIQTDSETSRYLFGSSSCKCQLGP